MGGRKGGAFQRGIGGAASDFALQLQGQRQTLQRQAIKDLMGFSSDLLDKRPYERTLTEKSKPWWQTALTGAAQGVSQGVGQSAGAALFA